MKHVFIVGSKGIPAQYGGYETFVDQLTGRQQNKNIKYHVICKMKAPFPESDRFFEYHGAECIRIFVPQIGSAQAIYYDLAALHFLIPLIKGRGINNPIIYILSCRIGPFIKHYINKVHKLNGKVFINPDGHEWQRAKWSRPVKIYWKISERLMVKNADLIICDSVGIEDYIKSSYFSYKPNTTYIAYGADYTKSTLTANDSKYRAWMTHHKITKNGYYLIVGRFVPENNYETMIREFHKSKSSKDLVIITDFSCNKLYDRIRNEIDLENDDRIKFVGTLYDGELLKKIREQAFGYLHGHSVGGTNPSLLEALASTPLNLLYDVKFNREVAQDGALYWTLDDGNLLSLLESAEHFTSDQINVLHKRAVEQIINRYSWSKVVENYEEVFQ